ncbi:superfamily II DNA or RNA helicase [Georgenia soli]|uniref:Superfamily II DNA or RNA helicase n=1 Tax=Georgenia soli TaxID=638953 RepID=A0A2A9EKA7_9MICO|nr:DEAD/DEAH box helicase [Georgenia soli]PFG39517.1 superfamily II DNA or RNA helicase [Georgenia soli]
MQHDALHDGLYESLVTPSLERKLAGLPGHRSRLEAVDAADEPDVLARHVAGEVARVLRDTRNESKRVELVNEILGLIQQVDQAVSPPTRQLLSLEKPDGVATDSRYAHRPRTPLADAALLTNAKGDPSLGAELRAELESAEQVDLLCAFVKWTGLRVLERELRRFTERGGRLRVITTTYIGATERSALDRLVRDFGAEVKIQYEIARTRLHAKSWFFHRHTGFNTAYVGSSNLSHVALLDGVEWNVRLSAVATPSLLHKFEATFETYWNDPSYLPYDPDRDADLLNRSLASAAGRGRGTEATLVLSGLEVTPYPHQKEILEQLDVERTVYDRHRNLVVAATGTGKTVIAALDYRDLARAAGRYPRLLFVAHRIEILQQALRTYRDVLADGSFGELWGQGFRPTSADHVFATIQSLDSVGADALSPDAYEILVVDEFHHAEAASYRRLLAHIKPRELLGLTATPERADGIDVAEEFFDGRTAAEIRLWDALEAELLSPFHYFGIADTVNLSSVRWSRGQYDRAELENVYTGNDARTRIILRQLRDKVADVRQMRALGFCVGVRHAQYMADVFNAAGIPARAVWGDTHPEARRQALLDLRDRKVNILFSADLYNEGLDLPDVDTVLFLRPTESATIFLQQLGRGLRQTRDKAVLTALDFVGHQRKEFRFDRRFRAMTGASRAGLRQQVEYGFPFLPSGSQIVLDRESQNAVLENIKSQLNPTWKTLVGELKLLAKRQGDVSLGTFLKETDLELADVLKNNKNWTRLREDAGLPVAVKGPLHASLIRRGRALAHVDDMERGNAYLRLLSDDAPHYRELDEREQRYARMLVFSLWPDGGGHGDFENALGALRLEAAARREFSQLIELGLSNIRHVPRGLEGSLAATRLRSHAHYTREEIVVALDYAGFDRLPNSFREGVFFSEPWQSDAFLVTLRKSEQDYSPTTMYNDYAISPELFHWESQSRTTVSSPTGQRYITHRERGTNVLLFAREAKKDALGTAPYMLLADAHYVTHEGERPMAITWRLGRALPTDLFQVASVAN